MREKLDLTVAKCVIGERSISRMVYDKIIKDLIAEIEKQRLELKSWKKTAEQAQDKWRKLNTSSDPDDNFDDQSAWGGGPY